MQRFTVYSVELRGCAMSMLPVSSTTPCPTVRGSSGDAHKYTTLRIEDDEQARQQTGRVGRQRLMYHPVMYDFSEETYKSTYRFSSVRS